MTWGTRKADLTHETDPETGLDVPDAGAIELLEDALEAPMLLVTLREPESGRLAEVAVPFSDVARRGVEVCLVDSVVRAWEQLGREGVRR